MGAVVERHAAGLCRGGGELRVLPKGR
jgi:hypothetical protein